MITIRYSASGMAVSDFHVEDTYYAVRQAIESHLHSDFTFSYSNEIMISRIRLGIVMGEIDYTNIYFMDSVGNKYEINRFGVIVGYFESKFCDYSDEIMKTAIKLRKETVTKEW